MTTARVTSGPRKEAPVDADALAVLDAVNDRAITRLAVPDGEPRPVEHEWKEPAAARERIVSAFAYSPSGQVTAADWEIRGLDRRTEINPANVLDPERRYAGARVAPGAPGATETKRVWRLRTEQPRHEALPGLETAQRSRNAIRDDRGLATETYRQITVDEALFTFA